jgi:hypothetical protein
MESSLRQEGKPLTFVTEFLTRTEASAAQQSAGMTTVQMARVQAKFVQANLPAASMGSWGGQVGKTRWQNLLAAEQQQWKVRADAAVKAVVLRAARVAFELELKETQFEWDPDGVDKSSLGAAAVGGSQPGKTVRIGFEFVVVAETDPSYALSTVVHELRGHPFYDVATGNYQQTIYDLAKITVPGAPSGVETYHYYPSEIYSLLRELSYFTAVAAADRTKSLSVPTATRTPQQINFNPINAVGNWLREIERKWDPSLVASLLRGFYQRLTIDPGITPAVLADFRAMVLKVFPGAQGKYIVS